MEDGCAGDFGDQQQVVGGEIAFLDDLAFEPGEGAVDGAQAGRGRGDGDAGEGIFTGGNSAGVFFHECSVVGGKNLTRESGVRKRATGKDTKHEIDGDLRM